MSDVFEPLVSPSVWLLHAAKLAKRFVRIAQEFGMVEGQTVSIPCMTRIDVASALELLNQHLSKKSFDRVQQDGYQTTLVAIYDLLLYRKILKHTSHPIAKRWRCFPYRLPEGETPPELGKITEAEVHAIRVAAENLERCAQHFQPVTPDEHKNASVPERVKRPPLGTNDLTPTASPYLHQPIGPYTATAWLWSAWVLMAAYGTRYYKDLPERWRLEFEDLVPENAWPAYMFTIRGEAKFRGADLPQAVWSPFSTTASYAIKLGAPLGDADRAIALDLASQLLSVVNQLHVAAFQTNSVRAPQADTEIEMKQGEHEAGERVQEMLLLDARNVSRVDPPPPPTAVHPLLAYANTEFRSKGWRALIELFVGGNSVSLNAAKLAASGKYGMTKEALQAVIDRINERLGGLSEVLGATYAIQWKGPTELILRAL